MQARETQMMGGVKREDRKKTVDSIAASYILESWLTREKIKEKKEQEMKDEELMEEEYDEEEHIIEVEDEDGNIERLLHIATVIYKGQSYCVFQKAEPETEEDEDEAVIFLFNEEKQTLDIIEDEQLLDEVFAEYCRQYENSEYADEARRLDD